MRTPEQTFVTGLRGHRHFWKRALSRREFLGASAAATGAAITADLWLPVLAQASDESAAPRPIHGSLVVNNTLFHLNLPNAGDQSPITDFKGLIAATDTTGTGAGIDPASGATVSQVFDADMRFVQGTYIGLDGEEHEGAFGFI